jgi:hypothetical protein
MDMHKRLPFHMGVDVTSLPSHPAEAWITMGSLALSRTHGLSHRLPYSSCCKPLWLLHSYKSY